MSSTEVRLLDEASWHDAVRLCGRAFSDYEYVHALFGPDPLLRLAGVSEEFAAIPWEPSAFAAGAWSGPVLVGVAVADRPGGCRVCTREPLPEPALGDAVARAGWEFDRVRRASHPTTLAHSQLRCVAVEPLAHRSGVGRTVVAAALAAFDECGGGPIVLECIEQLEAFYARHGFASIGRFRDPVADGMLVMMRAPERDRPSTVR
jgi:GNAT superfamily N-acetyltransferase